MKKFVYAISLLLILTGTILPGGNKNSDGILLSSSLTIQNVIAAAGTNVSVPVKVQGLSNVGAISLKIRYTSALAFTGISTTTGLSYISNAAGGVVSIAWVDFTGVTPYTFPDGSAMLNLNFTYSGGSAPITFDTVLCQIANGEAVPIAVSFINGGVTLFSGTFPALSIGNTTALNNTTTKIPLNAQTFTNIRAFTFKISYNTSVLTYTGLSNTFNGITISNSAASGVLTLSWTDLTGTSPITITNGLLANMNFTYISGSGPVSFNSSLSEVTNSLGQIISGVVYTNGSIAQAVAPAAPVLSSPLTGAVNQPVALTLTWGSVPTAQTYRVQVSTDPLFATTVKDSSGLTMTSMNIASLNNNIKYYWRVNATYLGLTGSYSTVSNFTTIVAFPSVPVLTSPANNSVNQPQTITLNWNTVPVAATYRVQVATDSLFTLLVLNDSTVTTNSRVLTGLLTFKKYYWRINSKNLAGTSGWSAIWNFKTLSLSTVSGKVLYASTVPQNVKNVNVALNPGGFTSTTDMSGSFNLVNVPNGSYTFSATTANPWSSSEINATDALWIAQSYVGQRTFTEIQNLAADVNIQSGVNNTDALLIVRRWAGLTTIFPSGDWVYTYPAVTVADSNVNLNINTLLAGDVNGSSSMSVLPKQSFISFEEKGMLQIKQIEEFNIAVTIDQMVKIGAMNLSFNYPKDLASFEGINSSAENIIINDKNGNVKIAWFDISGGQKPLSLKSGSSIIILRFKPTSAFKTGSRFSVQFDEQMCEFASEEGNILPSVSLQFPAVSLAAPTEYSLMQNYPNPFNPSTIIKYTLAYESNVTLKIFNSLGQNVREFNEGTREQGNYEITFNAAGLASGIYLFSISAQSTDGKNSFSAVKKMIIQK